MKYGLLLLVAVLLFSSCNNTEELHRKTVPVLWGCTYGKAKNNLNDYAASAKEPHPLDIGRYLFYNTLKYEETGGEPFKEMSHAYINLINDLHKDTTYFNNNSFKYNFGHDHLKPGWWSGMANSAILLGLVYADEVYGTDNNEIIEALITNLTTDFKQGGSLENRTENTNWILEYAWDGMKEESIKSVLNGFVFALVCIKTADEIKPNPKLEQLFNKGVQALKEEAENFYFTTNEWTKYDLKPTIESLHYCIFDIILLESLLEFLPEEEERSWIEKDIAKRRAVLKNAYRLNVLPKGDQGYELMFSMVGAPHPYWIDIYPLEIEVVFKDRDTRTIQVEPPKKFSIPIEKRGFAKFSLSHEEYLAVEEYRFFCVYSRERQEVFRFLKDEPFAVNEERLALEEIKIKSTHPSFDAAMDSTSVVVDPALNFDANSNTYKNNIAQVLLKFGTPVDLKEHENLALAVENDIDINSHKFFVYTVDGKVYERYYLPIKKGKNVIVLNPVGFMDFNTDEKVKMIAWRIYTSKLEEKGQLNLTGMYRTSNNYQLQALLSKEGYSFEEKKVRGNIY
ncbi:MAG: D-glucuronyl C5-epimerase family protein [Flavobacteriaceae bacterium]